MSIRIVAELVASAFTITAQVIPSDSNNTIIARVTR